MFIMDIIVHMPKKMIATHILNFSSLNNPTIRIIIKIVRLKRATLTQGGKALLFKL